MTLFLDTEFNGFDGGELISIALVSDRPGRNSEFYAVTSIPDHPTDFVRTNVIPRLAAKPEPRDAVVARLLLYLGEHLGEPILFDWPYDGIHLLSLLVVPCGRWHAIPLNLQLVTGATFKSRKPHNALSDARAFRSWYRRRK